ncbi:hypothetical protein L2089_15605 [Paenibacillus hunanensis]|uniref:hypothetical protein n=1 Tax=Paenibacillus hunanensis TaxID=539262 RepID=UPI0020274C5F|nr:hypothetical protein [Paenibacillus hunanensis]MCL9662120.1 hypothetical protein [Paenibacillus hunanensis]
MNGQQVKEMAKAVLKSIIQKLLFKVLKAILLKVLAYISPVLILIIVVVLLFAAFFDLPFSFGGDEGGGSDIAYFTTGVEGDDEWNLDMDKDLYNQYITLVDNGIEDKKEPDLSFGAKKRKTKYQLSEFEQAETYKLSWAVLAATDRVFGDPTLTDKVHRKPNPEEMYRALGPRFQWKSSTTTVTVCGKDSCSTTSYETPLISVVSEFKQKTVLTYKQVTEKHNNGKTTVVREVVSGSKITSQANKLLSLVYDHGLTLSDEQFIIELSKAYDSSFMNYELGGDYLVDTGYVNSAIPAAYIPIYKAAAKKYGISWYYLAAIHYQETRFSTDPTMVSSAGAIGHMQVRP